MKNNFIYTVIFSFALTACTTLRAPIDTPEVNQKVKHEGTSEMLLGHCSRSCLLESPYKEWFEKNYADYSVDTVTAKKLKPLLRDKTLLVFLGTWCGDSRREVPPLAKIVDYCGLKDSQLQLVMVDYREGMYKQSPQHEERGRNIFRVPTIIIYSGRKEIGRIIEFPKQSLEKDLLSILTKADYSPNYPGGNWLYQVVQNSSLEKLRSDSASIIEKVKPQLRGFYELNSIARVLADAGEKDKAAFVFNLNRVLYPDGDKNH